MTSNWWRHLGQIETKLFIVWKASLMNSLVNGLVNSTYQTWRILSNSQNHFTKLILHVLNNSFCSDRFNKSHFSFQFLSISQIIMESVHLYSGEIMYKSFKIIDHNYSSQFWIKKWLYFFNICTTMGEWLVCSSWPAL